MKVVFEWDDGNNTKNYSKHGISIPEAESMFQDARRIDFPDPLHSVNEPRYISIGQSSRPRLLFAAWTLRAQFVRIISIRPASLKERQVYAKNKE
jgi:uncharacterized DUF497 family protein